MFFCVRARAMHHPELQQTTHTRGSTSAMVSILVTEQKVKGVVQTGRTERGQQSNSILYCPHLSLLCNLSVHLLCSVIHFYVQFDS